MITLCTVLLGNLEDAFSIMLDSVSQKMKLVTEIIAVRVDTEEASEQHLDINGIHVRRYNCPLSVIYGHALGLHECIRLASQDYLMFCDPDIFFYSDVDKLYMDMFEKYNLNIAGISHHAATNQSYTFFPCVMNCLVRKSQLPGEDWLKEYLKIRPSVLNHTAMTGQEEDESNYVPAPGKYLLVGHIPQLVSQFPNKNPGCNWDVGCNLWLWAHRQSWNWLSFQTLDCHNYDTKYHRSNLGKLNLPRQKLLYHCTSSSLKSDHNCFRAKYEESLQND